MVILFNLQIVDFAIDLWSLPMEKAKIDENGVKVGVWDVYNRSPDKVTWTLPNGTRISPGQQSGGYIARYPVSTC